MEGEGHRRVLDLEGMEERKKILDSFRKHPQTTVLIVGGGVTGCGLFRELALQGIDCVLAERRDFVSGASSKSSRMIHGGLRYLENGEFRLVRESLAERNRLLAKAPHYVRPLKTTIPLFSYLGGLLKCPLIFLGAPLRPGGRGALVVKGGLLFYDLVTRKDRRTPPHFFQGRRESLREIPGLNPQIKATATYYDAFITHAERLCIELVQEGLSCLSGARALNYFEVVAREGGEVHVGDVVTGQEVSLRPQVVVNAAGAWVDAVNKRLGCSTRFIGGTKGSHLVVENEELRRALGGRMVYYEYADGRICIVFPFYGKILMGSTDIPIDDPDQAHCTDEEQRYMLATLQHVFPGIRIREEQILCRFSGVRPLPVAQAEVPGRISRDHRIEILPASGDRPFPILSLFGGKWTTFRAIGERAAEKILSYLGAERRVSTAERSIGGGRRYPQDPRSWIARCAQATGLREDRIRSLLGRYGTGAEDLARELGRGGEVMLTELPEFSKQEVERIVRNEYVVHLSDFVFRRTLLGIRGQATEGVLQELASCMAPLLGWDERCKEEEIDAVLRECVDQAEGR